MASHAIAVGCLSGTDSDSETRETTPLFPERVFEAPRHPSRIPPESAWSRRESARKADSNTSMAGWRRSAGRRAVHRTGSSSTASSDGNDWGGQASPVSQPTKVRLHTQDADTCWMRSRAAPLRRRCLGGVHWSTRGKGSTLKRNKAQGSIGPAAVETQRAGNGLGDGATP